MTEQKFMTKKYLKKIIPILLVLTIVISSAAVGLFAVLDSDAPTETPTQTVSTPSENKDDTVKTVEKLIFNNFKSISLCAGEDFLLDEISPEDAVREFIKHGIYASELSDEHGLVLM